MESSNRDSHARDELEGLYEISQAFGSLENERATFRQVTERIARFIGAEVCAVARTEEGGRVVRGVPPGFGVTDEEVTNFEFSITPELAPLWGSESQYVILNDVTRLPLSLGAAISAVGVQQAVAARMMRRGHPVGLIFAANRTLQQPFQDRHGQLLRILAGQAAIALENARLYATAQENLQNVTRLYAISAHLATRSDLDGIPARVVNAVAEALRAPIASIALMNPTTGQLQYAATLGVPPEAAQLGFRENGVAMTVLRTGTPRFVEDIRKAEDVNPVTRVWGFRATACLPIQHGDQHLGVLYVNYSEPHRFTPVERNMLAIFANQAAIALENARLQRGEQRKTTQLERIAALSGSLAETMELEDMLRVVEREIKAALPQADAGALLIFDSTRGVLTPRASFGFDREHLKQIALAVGEGAPGRVFESGQSMLFVGQAAADVIHGTMQSGNQSRLQAARTGIAYPTSIICVPLSPGGEKLGTIVLDSYESAEAFTSDDLHLLEAMADRAALAIRNAELYARGMRRAAQLAAVADVAHQATAILDLDVLLPTVAQLIHRQFGYRYVHVFLNDPVRKVTVFRAGAGEAAQAMARQVKTVRYGFGIVGWVAEQGKLLLANNVSAEPRFVSHPLLPDTRAELALPLEAGGRIVGLLDVQSESVNAFEASDVATLQTLAGQVAIAIDNAMLYGRVQEQARRDSLTMAYNHGYFLESLGAEIERATLDRCPLSLIMMDIDFFKEYNDQYGHVVGDMVLGATVQAISAHVHKTDVVGRWGGEEFGIALLDTDPGTALLVARRVRTSLREARITTKEGLSITPPTVSQGIATFPTHACDAASLIDLADNALYRAKSRGRDQICVEGE